MWRSGNGVSPFCLEQPQQEGEEKYYLDIFRSQKSNAQVMLYVTSTFLEVTRMRILCYRR